MVKPDDQLQLSEAVSAEKSTCCNCSKFCGTAGQYIKIKAEEYLDWECLQICM